MDVTEKHKEICVKCHVLLTRLNPDNKHTFATIWAINHIASLEGLTEQGMKYCNAVLTSIEERLDKGKLK
jgi:hypothetical protein